MITESQIELMKRLAAPKLKRAIVRSPITGQFETAEYRISKRLKLRLLILNNVLIKYRNKMLI